MLFLSRPRDYSSTARRDSRLALEGRVHHRDRKDWRRAEKMRKGAPRAGSKLNSNSSGGVALICKLCVRVAPSPHDPLRRRDPMGSSPIPAEGIGLHALY
jgi:hypothetical protein